MRHPKYGYWNPYEIELMEDLDRVLESSRRERRLRTTPNERFRDWIRSNCLRGICNKWLMDDVWIWNDSVVFELAPIKWDDAPGSEKWLWYWNRAYVVDGKKTSGEFSRFLDQFLYWVDSSGVALCLFSYAFGFDLADIGKPSYLETAEDVCCSWNIDICPTGLDEWLSNYYRKRGFRNCWIGWKNKPMPIEKYPLERQLVYVGKDADYETKTAVETRIKNSK